MMGNTNLQHLPKHGTLIRMHGLGVFITGQSGVGKSECALELVNQGASLVCDDAPLFSYQSVNEQLSTVVIGRCSDKFKGKIYIRQLGIIYLPDYFSDKSTKKETTLELIINLVDKRNQFDQNAKENHHVNNMDIALKPIYQDIIVGDSKIKQLDLWVTPQRNMALLVNLAIQQYKQLFTLI